MKIKALISLFISVTFISANAQNIGLIYNKEAEKTAFAVQEIERSLQEKGIQSVKYALSQQNQKRVEQTSIVLISLNERNAPEIIKKAGIKNATELRDEGFLVQNTVPPSRDEAKGIKGGQKTIYILGKDEAGLMYGGLEVAEIIKVQGMGAVNNQLQNPYMKVRGTKFNIPLDIRSPTYTEPSDAAQKNMPEMWNFEFWKEYIDALARNRYTTYGQGVLDALKEQPDRKIDFIHRQHQTKASEISIWSCGNTGTWVWERVTVNLEKGDNTIAISPEKFVLLDHLNVIKTGQ
jgi:hypothetical protein